MKKTISLLLCSTLFLGGMLMSACNGQNNVETASETPSASEWSVPDDASENSVTDNNNLAFGCPYFYDCGVKIKGDKELSLLTDGKTQEFALLSPSLDTGKGYTFTANDWNGNTHKLTVDNKTAAVSVDLGFMSEVNGFEISIKNYLGAQCEVFYSTDGYNYSFYAGKVGEYKDGKLSGGMTFTAKSVMFVLPIDSSTTLEISEIKVFGTSEYSKILLSQNASYVWNGKDASRYLDNGKKLTDGKTTLTDGREAVAGKSSDEKDSLTGKSGNIITIDLGSVKNVSEVLFGVHIPENGVLNAPLRVNARYSNDGENWFDLGQSFLRSSSNERGSSSRKYLITRNHTVEARYVKLLAYNNGTEMLLCDEIYVYGCDSKVNEPDYGYINRKNQISNSNIISHKEITFNGRKTSALTNCTYTDSVSGVKGNNKVEIFLDKENSDLCGASLTFKAMGLNDFEILLDGVKLENVERKSSIIGDNATLYFYFSSHTAKNMTISFNSSVTPEIREVSVYSGVPHLPLIRGGFFQLPTTGSAGDTASDNSDYSWYLQLKGMKDLGMDTVVIQYSTHFNDKTTIINGKHITEAGYRYTSTYGSKDVCGAVLDAADKLGMKVYLGTVHDADFTNPIANMPVYEKMVEDSKYIIDDINEMYSSHISFAGYYLSDEECDQWLNMSGGVKAGRAIYKGQSDYIRKVAPNAKIMIAPAIWRSGDATKGADNLYRLIAPEDPDGLPVVDIVAEQDCLGRLPNLTVDDSVYDSYEKYCAEWAKAVRRAGAEFWHDAEVFEVTSTSKRYDELVKSLGIEAKMSNMIIVFDISHYFTLFPSASFDDVRAYYKTLIIRDYVRYYSGFEHLDRMNQDADIPEVENNDGRVVEEAQTSGKPAEQKSQHNKGILTNVTASIENADKLNWQKFSIANSSGCPEFAYSFDDKAFYVAVRTMDKTDSFGKGDWWEGKDDLIQIWMIATGETASDVLGNPYGIRYYLHRNKSGYAAGGETGGNADITGFSYTESNGTVIVKMPWDALAIAPQKANCGYAVGVHVQYVDGADGSWAASNGNKGRSLSDNSLYSY